jgi:type II secretory pathway component PulC
MLRGLVIRRVFAVLDLALCISVLAACGIVLHGVCREARNPFADNPIEVASLEEPGSLLHDVGARADYDRIVKSRIFGPAGDEPSAPDAAPPPPPPTEEVQETKLNLSLRGTVTAGATDPLASATIENKDTRTVDVYGLGSEIVPEVLLAEVRQREVIISNKGKKEVLRMEEAETPQALAAASSAGRPPSRSAPSSTNKPRAPSEPPQRFSLNKNEFIKQLYVNYADLVTKIKPEYYYDSTGKVAGVTASNLKDIPLAGTLDMRDGDVLQTINGERIDSEEKIIELINRNRDTKTFRIGILRDGRPLTRVYQLE